MERRGKGEKHSFPTEADYLANIKVSRKGNKAWASQMALWVKALAAKSLYQNPRGRRLELTPESGPLTRMNVHAHAHTGTHTLACTHIHAHAHTHICTQRGGSTNVAFVFFCFFKEGRK